MTKKRNSEDLRMLYGLTMVLVPTILMAIVSQYLTNFFVKAISQVIIFFLQAIIIHGILQNKYSY